MRLWATLCTYRLNWARPCCGCHCHPYDSDTKDLKFPILPIYRERKPTGVATGIPARTKHLYTMCTTSAQNLRRWPNIVQMLYKFTFHVAKQRFQPVTWSGGGPRVVVSTAAFHARVRGSVPGLGGFKETKMFLPHPRVKVSIVGSLRDREVACSASDRQGSNFESCVWRTVSSQSSHHPQEVLLAQFSLYVHKGGLKPDSFHFILSPGQHSLIMTYLKGSVSQRFSTR